MKSILLSIVVITIFASPSVWFDQSFASCMAENEINWNAISSESELVFTGTVTRLDNYDGPQRVTFFIHEAVKGKIDTPKHVLENSGKVFLENDTVGNSSVGVDYKIGKTYKVYVTNGDTNQCTTKITTPPADYIWEPGPEDGNYYSENPVWEDPCDEGYGLSDDVCITLEEMNRGNPICSANPRHDFGKCNKNTEEPPNTFEQVKYNCDNGGKDIFLEWWNDDVYYNNEECEMLDRNNSGPPPPHLEPEPEPESVFEDDKKRYCDYAVKRDLPTPWKYNCYDHPAQNPQREMDFGNPMLGDDDLLDCNDADNVSMCFDDAFDSCIPAKIEQGMSTVEGDPVYTGAYITDDCKIHVISDNREDKWSSLADRKITESKCSSIQFKGSNMIISNCDDWNVFEFYDEGIFCIAGSELIEGVCTVNKEIDDDGNISKYLALFYFSMIPVWFASSVLYFVFGKRYKKLIVITLIVIGVLWVIGILTNYIPTAFG